MTLQTSLYNTLNAELRQEYIRRHIEDYDFDTWLQVVSLDENDYYIHDVTEFLLLS